ncbi:hypothetical protein OG539_41100 [Actinacidiphila glaucinigra]|uniref:hypothetical protein n=1 Tax=Actinacidiphila glaucinigra TaxID=235986 RepID=UPI002DDA208A|nr:hypothetical protein [Actinacidiphila glaucinigra]WSD57846.1 hypothetical protein OIE69_02390 [Actinacidiphila glaucinigra]
MVVVAAVVEERVASFKRPADQAGYGRDLYLQRCRLRDVVAIAATQRHGERDVPHVKEEMVLAARPGTVDRAEPV